jgi:hypothetical protein
MRPSGIRRWREFARAGMRDVAKRIPPEAAAEIRDALMRLRKARSPRQAVAALEEEVERLFGTIAPKLVEHPLPIGTSARATATVAIVAGAAATVEEVEALALLIPGVNIAASPGIAAVAAASFTSLVIEAYVAGSLRVNMLRAAGITPEPNEIARDVLRAMTGRDDVRLTKIAAQGVTRRVLRRWARGVVPFVGIGYAGWDARKTIRAITRMPLAGTSPAAPLSNERLLGDGRHMIAGRVEDAGGAETPGVRDSSAP